MNDTKPFYFRSLRIWASGGMIRVENRHTGEYLALSISKAKHRVAAIVNMRDGTDDSGLAFYLSKLIRDFEDAIEAATAQGDPCDDEAEAGKWRRREKRTMVSLDTPLLVASAPGLILPPYLR